MVSIHDILFIPYTKAMPKSDTHASKLTETSVVVTKVPHQTLLFPWQRWQQAWTWPWLRTMIFFAVVPLILVRILGDYIQVQQAAGWLGLYFALIWGYFLKRALHIPEIHWRLLLFLAFWNVSGGLLWVIWGQELPVVRQLYALISEDSVWLQLLGYCFGVGLNEELGKILPLWLMIPLWYLLRWLDESRLTETETSNAESPKAESPKAEAEDLSTEELLLLSRIPVPIPVVLAATEEDTRPTSPEIVFRNNAQQLYLAPVMLYPNQTAFYGAVCGLAFGVAEGIAYALNYESSLLRLESTAGDYLIYQFLRLITLPMLHAAFSGLAGYYLGVALQPSVPKRSGWQILGILLLGLLVALTLHGLYNFWVGTWYGIGMAALTIYLFVGAAYVSRDV